MILSARWVVPVSGAPLENGAVLLANGQIAGIGPADELLRSHPETPARHFPNAALMPGFINAHSHLELTVLRGYLESLDFWSWIRSLTRTKYEVLSHEEIRLSALLGAVEAIRAGVTTVGDPMDIGASLDAVLASGLRGMLFQEVFSPKAAEADSAVQLLQGQMQALEARLAAWPGRAALDEYISHVAPQVEILEGRSQRVRLGISPHSPYTVSASLFQKAAAFAHSRRYPLCIHAAESEPESQLLKEGQGPIAESYLQRGIAWNPPGCSPVEYLRRLGVLSPETLLVHCIRLEAQDFAVLRDAGVAVAHCPKSNCKLGHGFMDLRQMLEHRIVLGLGSDSVASNNTMDLFEEMRFVLGNPSLFQCGAGSSRALRATPSANWALRMATLGGAEALGLAVVTGSLDCGKEADLIAVDLSKPHCAPVFSPVDALVYSARGSDVQFTMVAGEVLFDKGEILGIEEGALSRRIDSIREKLLNARKP